MRIFSRRRLPAGPRHVRGGMAPGLLTFAALASLSEAFTFNSVSSPDLDLSDLGYTGIVGDFNGISLYQWEGQNESPFSANGSETLMTQLPNGQFVSVLAADGSIQAMCSFQGSIIVGGNFTSLDGQESVGVASFDPNTTTVTPWTGLSGQVNSLLCDEENDTVYIGGSFTAQNSTNAVTWVSDSGLVSLPFAGFNGPVASINKASTGHIIFGGSFTGLGNTSTPSAVDEQIINLSTANITSTHSSTTSGFSDPRNIVCQTSGVDGSGTTWLLENDTFGSWTAQFEFGFEPTKLRLYNTHLDGRGTKTWRFTAFPIDGIMNFTYVDPETNQNMSCTSECPLSSNSSVEYQEFVFVNQVGMNEFRIDISEYYGSGGGLNGIEIFQDGIFAYAVSDFNEPICSDSSFPSNATSTGPWSVHASGGSSSEYLSAQLTGTVSSESAAVTFFPDIRQAGNYTVSLYTPGCIQDDTCTTRNQVNVTWKLSADDQSTGNSKILYQTNNYDKYDVLATTQIDESSSSFRPSVILTPADNLDTSNMTIVAQRVQFALVNSTGGLNGLFEYDSAKGSVDTSEFSTSVFDKLGSGFATGSAVQALAVDGEVTYIGGNFSSSTVNNVVAINAASNTTIEMSGGLDGSVSTMYSSSGQVFVGGAFNNTSDNTGSGMNNVAVYDTSSNTWSALGAGVDGPVYKIAPMSINVSSSTPEEVIALTGYFNTVLAFDNNTKIPVDGFAIWVKSQNNWIQNINGTVPEINGILTTSLLNVTNGTSIYAGSISSQQLLANDVASMGQDSLGSFPIKIQKRAKSTTSTRTSSAKISKRSFAANSTDSIHGVAAGAFYESGGKNITVLGGRFTASATNGSDVNNLVLLDTDNGDAVSGLPSALPNDSVVLALIVQDDSLFVGGELNTTIDGQTVSGLLSYNLADATFTSVQPQPLKKNTGNSSIVTTITVRPDTSDVYAGGSFDAAGSLDCPGVCLYSTSSGQWSRPGLGFDGDVSAMIWTSSSTLVVGGDLKVSETSVYMASYDAKASTWKTFDNDSSLPGPIGAITAANKDTSQLWVAGTESNSDSVYLMKYDGSSWQTPNITFGANTVIRSLQVFTITTSHDSTTLVDADNVLMITGSVNIPGFGTASSALFNGTTLTPYALTSTSGNTAGSIARVFVQKENFFSKTSKHPPPPSLLCRLAC